MVGVPDAAPNRIAEAAYVVASAVAVEALPVRAPVNPVEVTDVSPVIVAGSDRVTAPVEALAVIWLAVPVMLVGSAVQDSAAPEASTPSGNVPAAQLDGFAASAVAVPAFPAIFVVHPGYPPDSANTCPLVPAASAVPTPAEEP